MIKFLRYKGRHSLYFSRDRLMPELDPYCYCSHSKSRKRTVTLYEPSWVYAIRTRLFCFGGRQRCPDRSVGGTPDHWHIGPDGLRTCSYCGSVHFDDLMAICRKAIDDERYGVEWSTKSYKLYVTQPNVRNSSEGAIKFYGWHVPPDAPSECNDILTAAISKTTERYMAKRSR